MPVTENRSSIRPAEAGDLEHLVDLLRQLFAIEEDFQVDAARQQRGLTMMLSNPRGRILVAERDDRVIGMCSGQLLISTAEGGPALLLEDVIVDENFRGLGIGRLLISAMAQWAADQGACRLQLLADRTNNEALTFYKRLGWKTTKLICLRHYLEIDQPRQ